MAKIRPSFPFLMVPLLDDDDGFLPGGMFHQVPPLLGKKLLFFLPPVFNWLGTFFHERPSFGLSEDVSVFFPSGDDVIHSPVKKVGVPKKPVSLK